MKPEEIMNLSKIVPVISINNEKDALNLANSLHKIGINIMEITLRTPQALKCIEHIAKNFPTMNVGAGTVCNTSDLIHAKQAGAKFVFSPGISEELITSAKEQNITLIPGVSTASEVMLAQNSGIVFCKLFPATLSGGVDILKAFSGPFSSMKFCPTGGINLKNMNDFLGLENVACIGGTWIVPKDVIEKNDFKTIEALCKEALNTIKGK